MVAEEAALQRRAGSGHQLRRLPPVAAKQRDGEPNLPRLARNGAHLAVVAGYEHAIGLGALNVVELRLEVLIALLIGLLVHNLAAQPCELIRENLRELNAVIVLDVLEDGGGAVTLIPCEVRHHGRLEVIREADTEDVVTFLGNFRVRGGGSNERYLGFLRHGSAGHGARARRLAQHGLDLVLADQLDDGGARLICLALCVFHKQLYLLSVNSPSGIGFLDGQHHPSVGRFPKGCRGARQRREVPHQNLVPRRGILALLLASPTVDGHADRCQQERDTPEYHA